MKHADSLAGQISQPMIYASSGMRSWKPGSLGLVITRSTPVLEPLRIFQNVLTASVSLHTMATDVNAHVAPRQLRSGHELSDAAVGNITRRVSRR
jgi:hypothetical protein